MINNAAALMLCAIVLASGGREIVVSRGELVEIGDGFRIPDLLATELLSGLLADTKLIVQNGLVRGADSVVLPPVWAKRWRLWRADLPSLRFVRRRPMSSPGWVWVRANWPPRCEPGG